MAALAPLVGSVAGVERRPIRFEADGLRREASAGELIDQACEGVPSVGAAGRGDLPRRHLRTRSARGWPSPRPRAAASTAFGIDWDDATGNRNARS